MKLPFNFIVGRIASNKMKSFIDDGISHSEEIFRDVKKHLPKNLVVKGFASVQKVPFLSHGLIAKTLIETGRYKENPISRLILKGWYLRNIVIIDKVRDYLIEQGYKVNQVDFNSDVLEISSLNEKDIFHIDDCIYFRPNGEKIQEISDVNSTIAATLLGWIVLSEGFIDQFNINPDCKSQENEISDQIKSPDDSQIETATAELNIAENSELPANIPATVLINECTPDVVDNIIDSSDNPDIENQILSLETKFKETGALLFKVAQELSDGKLTEIEQIDQIFLNLKSEFTQIASNLGISASENLNSLADLKEFREKSLSQEKEIEAGRSSINIVIEKIKGIRMTSGKTPEFLRQLYNHADIIGLQTEIPDFLNKDWFIQIKDSEHYFNHIIQAIELRKESNIDYDSLDIYLDKIKSAFLEHQIDFFEQLSLQINRGTLYILIEIEPNPTNTDGESEATESLLKVPETDNVEQINSDESQESETSDNNEANVVDEVSSVEETNDREVVLTSNDENIQLEDVEVGMSKIIIDEFPQEKESDSSESPGMSTLDKEETEPNEFDNLKQEDKNILSLLEKDEPELAYHLARCYEADSKELFLSSSLLHNLVISNEIRSSTGSVAQKISDNLESYDLHPEETDKWQFKNQLIFASILRPCFIAYDTSGAGDMLNEIQSGRFSEFLEIRSLITELMTLTGGVLNFESLLQIWGESDLKQKKENYKSNLITWLLKAQNKSFKSTPNHFHSIAYNNWVKKGGWINEALNTIIQDEKTEDLNLLIENLEDSIWKKRRDKELKLVLELKGGSGNIKSLHDDRDAITWITNNINELKEMLNEGVVYFDSENSTKNYQLHDFNLPEYVVTITNEFEKIESLLSSVKGENVFYNISYRYITKAIANVKKILSGVEPLGETVNSDQIINMPLQKLYCYESEIDWSPKFLNDSLIDEILKYSIRPKMDILEIAGTHVESGNYEAFNRLRKVYNIEDVPINSANDEKYFRDKNKFNVYKTNGEVEKGCAYGYILNGHRSALISSIDEISKRHTNSDGINYPLTKQHLDRIILKIELEKNRLISDYRNNIPKDIPPDYQQKLNRYLENGNLLVFNDVLDRMKSNQYVLSEDGDGSLSDFSLNFLSPKDGTDINSISNALKKGLTHLGIDFSKLTVNQSSEINGILKTWSLIKNIKTLNVDETFPHLNSILENLGFISAKMEKHGVFGKTTYFDFTCSPISGKDRTPIPQFGSTAQGKYRIACIRDRLNEEDLIQMIDKVTTPDTNRALLVFYFVWMDQESRIELSKLSKRKRLTFLLLDEAILVYLFVSNQSKFPLLIKLAAPLAFAEPYQTASSNLPEEMFYGRGPQIQKLKNITGDFSCLIYGGRQLGKTVLQREVERIFHNPEMQHYAIYIDLRSYGIGVWNQNEKIAFAIHESLKNIPELFSEKPQSSFGLPYVISKIKEWLGRNEESRIILFLDESDKFLKQDSLKEWPHLWPLKGLMDDTKNRFKLILAGLHDVRRTINIPNNPLAHFGTPICVGSMLEKDESLEAQKLIKIPLETLGYEFQSEDQVFMILSHCNWYPSLIQIFCSSLLKIMNDKKIIKQLPVLITDNDVTNAYKNSRELIKEKFHLTLGLDERYDLLANLIAGETFENPLVQSQGISVDDITYLATIQWSSGFDSSNTKIQVTNFLNEMVDLGILRIESPGMYALRTPNLLGLIGTEKQIAENINKERLHSEYDREFFRIMYQKGNREQRSPLPVSYYDLIVDPELKVIVFRGSIMGGINYIGEFLKSRSKEINLILPDFQFNDLNSMDEFWISIEKRRSSNKRTVILFDANYNFSIENIMSVQEKIGKKSITAIFLMDSPMIWEIISRFDKSFVLLENENIPVINLPLWREDVIKEWFTETGCITAKIPNITTIIGEWHHLLDKYHASIAEHPEMWKEKLQDFESEILSNRPDLYMDLGIINPRMSDLLKELITYDRDKITKHDFVELYSADNTLLEVSYFLEYFSCLNLINSELKVNPFVKKVLKDE